ncbi:MAG: tetraacyldisaccharide 4'-kinase [Rhodovarius sp.]|nr:tetraacyldisaccharide 4'-kinase [Rhodovarius sp.]MCX7933309.1 tetraacyldisaccharide 4'-kinase [Rhodovarius sp.]MDW8314609.1 tetraacyldisaccharide 4'-kinase [Rhodovarius sp.]
MRAPGFWSGGGGVLPLLLSPFAAAYAGVTARRMARPGWKAPVPVICCGNATAGGAGKTTLALDIGQRLHARGVAAHFLLRGYGGSLSGPVQVDPARHTVREVGDEALILAQQQPTWVAANRAAGARAAVAAGAQAIVMDDGLQNPTLQKDLSLLTIDGSYGFGNGRCIPAGPLREPVAAAAARCQAAVLIGPDETGALAELPPGLPVLEARLVSGPEAAALAGRPVFAFCGIANPSKFFATLIEAGAQLAGRAAFADHYPYDEGDMEALLKEAAALRAIPVTTRKDIVRVPPRFRAAVTVVTIRLEWADPAGIERLLEATLQPALASA